jgi:hypothetical protein
MRKQIAQREAQIIRAMQDDSTYEVQSSTEYVKVNAVEGQRYRFLKHVPGTKNTDRGYRCIIRPIGVEEQGSDEIVWSDEITARRYLVPRQEKDSKWLALTGEPDGIEKVVVYDDGEYMLMTYMTRGGHVLSKDDGDEWNAWLFPFGEETFDFGSHIDAPLH